jgi:P-aminobenzoate N-oxygenase AurF
MESETMQVMTTTAAETTVTLARTEKRSEQLILASERRTLDPFVDVDWSVALDDSAYYLPPEWLPLYGTPAWEAMDEPERIAYSRHENAALCGAGIWFENMLMQVVLRHLAELPVTSPAHRYLLVEVADECRHSTMFGEFIRRAGTPAYSPPAGTDTVDSLKDLPGGRALGYLLILCVEELLDVINRATMKDDRIHSISREMAKLHVLEEARHVSFAKTYLEEIWPTLDADERAAVAGIAPAAVAQVAELTIDPAVYQELEIDGGAETARDNPHHRARITEGLSKLTTYLTALGVIDDTNRTKWEARGLLT